MNTTCGLQKLNHYLESCSYLQGHTPSKLDVQVFTTLSEAPQDTYSHVLRWYNHMKFLGLELQLYAGDDIIIDKISGQQNTNREQMDNDNDKITETIKLSSDNESCDGNSIYLY